VGRSGNGVIHLAVSVRNGLARFGGSRLQARQLEPIIGYQVETDIQNPSGIGPELTRSLL